MLPVRRRCAMREYPSRSRRLPPLLWLRSALPRLLPEPSPRGGARKERGYRNDRDLSFVFLIASFRPAAEGLHSSGNELTNPLSKAD